MTTFIGDEIVFDESTNSYEAISRTAKGCKVQMVIKEGEPNQVGCLNKSCDGDCDLIITKDGDKTTYVCNCDI